jgi:flagella basal body P-ring formation protein FlgA
MSAVTDSSPLARRMKKPSWFDPRLVLGAVLVLGSILLGARVVAGAEHRYQMVAVSRDLQAGSVLMAHDVRIVRVQLPDRGVYLSDPVTVIGKMLNRPVSRDELLPATALDSPPR